jgi:hypothetical protein
MKRWHFDNCKTISNKDRTPHNKGKKGIMKQSEETKQKKRNSQIARWANQKKY